VVGGLTKNLAVTGWGVATPYGWGNRDVTWGKSPKLARREPTKMEDKKETVWATTGGQRYTEIADLENSRGNFGRGKGGEPLGVGGGKYAQGPVSRIQKIVGGKAKGKVKDEPG